MEATQAIVYPQSHRFTDCGEEPMQSYEQIERNPKFQQLVSKRKSLGWTLSAATAQLIADQKKQAFYFVFGHHNFDSFVDRDQGDQIKRLIGKQPLKQFGMHKMRHIHRLGAHIGGQAREHLIKRIAQLVELARDIGSDAQLIASAILR